MCSQVVVLDVLLEVGESLRLFTVVLDAAGGAALDSSGLTSLVELALTNPLSEGLSLVDLDEGDLVLLGESGDQLLVDGVVAVLGEDAQVAVLLVEGLADLVEAFDDT